MHNSLLNFRSVFFETPCTRYYSCHYVVIDLQTSCKKVVIKPISGCVRTACSQLLPQVWNTLSPCYKVADGNRLATSYSNETNTGCSNKFGTSLLPSTC